MLPLNLCKHRAVDDSLRACGLCSGEVMEGYGKLKQCETLQLVSYNFKE